MWQKGSSLDQLLLMPISVSFMKKADKLFNKIQSLVASKK